MESWSDREAEWYRLASRLPKPSKTALAAASAERLFPLYRVFAAARDGDDDRSALLRRALDELWTAAETDTAPRSDNYAIALSVVPSVEQPDWIVESAFAQNAAAAVAYAAQTWQLDDPQQVVWALWQAIEAADSAADARPEAISMAFVDRAGDSIAHDCVLAANGSLGDLRRAASSDGSWGVALAAAWTQAE
ncbi:hypothetical protein ACF1AJ_10045 [Leifsonia sp. NPDC014704]|uniref:hypothetical protein n=1 Tax=Leifsonia sp. NPDC014704 TaxID=3364123 RepID=UPI0036F490A4